MPSAVAPKEEMWRPQPSKGRRGMLIPIFAGVAMVFFAVIIAPVWFVLNKSARESASVSTNRNTSPVGIDTNTNASANSNSAPQADIQFLSLDGRTMNLKEFSGRMVLLNFWAPSSETSRVEVPLLNDLQRKYGARGVQVIGLSYETAAQIRKFQEEIPTHYIVGVVGNKTKGEVGLAVPRFPTTYILDSNLRIRKQLVGVQTREAFEAAIQSLLSDQP
jgi:peroxiredoxin